jgi:hypothetical protein
VLASGGSLGALLVSPFNVKWRYYAQAGGVEGSKLCHFLVIFPVRCISSVSSRFYFRRHAFCFLPLDTILEFPKKFLIKLLHIEFSNILKRSHITIKLASFQGFKNSA